MYFDAFLLGVPHATAYSGPDDGKLEFRENRTHLDEGLAHRIDVAVSAIDRDTAHNNQSDGKVILEIAKMILEIGVDGTDEDFDRLLGYIAEAESHARCSWVDCETNADDLAEYYDLVLRVNRGDIFG